MLDFALPIFMALGRRRATGLFTSGKAPYDPSWLFWLVLNSCVVRVSPPGWWRRHAPSGSRSRASRSAAPRQRGPAPRRILSSATRHTRRWALTGSRWVDGADGACPTRSWAVALRAEFAPTLRRTIWLPTSARSLSDSRGEAFPGPKGSRRLQQGWRAVCAGGAPHREDAAYLT